MAIKVNESESECIFCEALRSFTILEPLAVALWATILLYHLNRYVMTASPYVQAGPDEALSA